MESFAPKDNVGSEDTDPEDIVDEEDMEEEEFAFLNEDDDDPDETHHKDFDQHQSGPSYATRPTSTAANEAEEDDGGVAVGIDLGTTFSCVAITRNGKTETVLNHLGHPTTPSVVFYEPDNILVGIEAETAGSHKPSQLIHCAKLVMGLTSNSELTMKVSKNWSFMKKTKDGPVRFQIPFGDGVREMTPQLVSSEILKHLVKSASARLGESVTKAVITVPANFSPQQKAATMQAAKFAKLKVLQLLTEPIAAAYAYGVKLAKGSAHKHILVFDLGGGTFDVSVVSIRGAVVEVRSSEGSTTGGENFNKIILDLVMNDFHRQHGISLERDAGAIATLRPKIEEAKKMLSNPDCLTANISVDKIHGDLFVNYTVTKHRFEQEIQPLLREMRDTVGKAITGAKLQVKDIDEVILAGGSTWVPAVRTMVQGLFNGKPLYTDLNPDEVVAHGAAMKAADCTGEGLGYVLSDIIGMPIGVPYPITKRHPIPRLNIVIPKYAMLPNVFRRNFVTLDDNRVSMTFDVYQGENIEVASENDQIGSITYEFPHPVREGTLVNTAWILDENGIVTLEVYRNRKDKVSLTLTPRLSSIKTASLKIDQDKIHQAEILSEITSAVEKEGTDTIKEFVSYCNKVIEEAGIEGAVDVRTGIQAVGVKSVAEDAISWAGNGVRTSDEISVQTRIVSEKAASMNLDVPVPNYAKRLRLEFNDVAEIKFSKMAKFPRTT